MQPKRFQEQVTSIFFLNKAWHNEYTVTTQKYVNGRKPFVFQYSIEKIERLKRLH